jgi:hypothetical protein
VPVSLLQAVSAVLGALGSAVRTASEYGANNAAMEIKLAEAEEVWGRELCCVCVGLGGM